MSVIVLAALSVKAQKQEITLESSVVCGMCKETIEDGLAYTKGIKSTRVDVDHNQIKIVYNAKQISEEEIKVAINALGYAAGDSKPTHAEFDKLHNCCKAKDAACD